MDMYATSLKAKLDKPILGNITLPALMNIPVPSEEEREANLGEAYEALITLAVLLQDGYLAGSRFTIADIAVHSQVTLFVAFLEVDLNSYSDV